MCMCVFLDSILSNSAWISALQVGRTKNIFFFHLTLRLHNTKGHQTQRKYFFKNQKYDNEELRQHDTNVQFLWIRETVWIRTIAFQMERFDLEGDMVRTFSLARGVLFHHEAYRKTNY